MTIIDKSKINTVRNRFSADDLDVEVEVVPELSQDEDFVSAFDEEMADIDGRLKKIEKKISRYDETVDRLTNHADKVDYIVAASCGLLTGLIDAFFIGDSTDAQEIGKTPVNNFVESFAKKRLYRGWRSPGQHRVS